MMTWREFRRVYTKIVEAIAAMWKENNPASAEPQKKVKIAVVGSRGFDDYDTLKAAILARYNPYEICKIISGGAKGADTLAEQFADEYHIGKEIYLPDWNRFGKAAGYRRNIIIIQACDVCFAFWDGTSKGTKMDIDLCKEAHKPCFVVNYLDSQQSLF